MRSPHAVAAPRPSLQEGRRMTHSSPQLDRTDLNDTSVETSSNINGSRQSKQSDIGAKPEVAIKSV